MDRRVQFNTWCSLRFVELEKLFLHSQHHFLLCLFSTLRVGFVGFPSSPFPATETVYFNGSSISHLCGSIASHYRCPKPNRMPTVKRKRFISFSTGLTIRSGTIFFDIILKSHTHRVQPAWASVQYHKLISDCTLRNGYPCSWLNLQCVHGFIIIVYIGNWDSFCARCHQSGTRNP